MYDYIFGSLYCLKGFLDNMFSGLSQHLDRHVVRDQVLFNQGTEEGIFRFGSGRKSYLNLLKSNLHQHFEELDLLFQVHRDHQRLVAVTQIHAAPDRRMIHIVFLSPVHTFHRGEKILPFVFTAIFHFFNSSHSILQ